MLKKILITVLVIFGITSCNKEEIDNKSVNFAVCDGIKQIKEVVINNVTVTELDTNNQIGYIIRATVSNKTDSEILDGRVIVTFFANNNPMNYNITGECNNLLPNSSCEFFKFVPIMPNENIDQNPVVACYYYEL
ncbi:hypothetical protein [Psychroserpens mesophilus]|uniref:hypothetical protein n=1 Tax=Psychroserpens mesophilus TaxID=325473 RepID=UPI00058B4B1A|nr:hypothetical protein [Psychroserpens mesophilus]